MNERFKPIETKYKGYRFRSRLEARWAVFFDHFGIEWDYEHEGFETQHGWYLPDFYFRRSKIYVEIKPALDADNFLTPECEPHSLLPDLRWLNFVEHRALFLVAGNPWPGEHLVYRISDAHSKPIGTSQEFPGEDFPEDEGWFYFDQFAQCRRCDSLVALVEDDGLGLHGHMSVEPCKCDGLHDKWPISAIQDPDNWVGRAYQAARSARFEHGETPQ